LSSASQKLESQDDGPASNPVEPERSVNGSKPLKLRPRETDPHVELLLKSIETGKQILQFQKNETAFSQGDPADSIFFIQSGKVKLTVVSPQGKEAVLAMLGARDFFGEGCLIGQPSRVATAMTIESCVVFRVQKQAMLLALHGQPELSEKFTAALLARNIHLEEDLCDQLFNHSEKRLARVLLKLNRLGQHADMPRAKMPRLSHETLAEMVGTTRSRITFFMNKFKKLGLIHYRGTGDITVNEELITDLVLHD
jgi:CRP/FNR family transcriptional regulator, cyclic AMP receptor protein